MDMNEHDVPIYVWKPDDVIGLIKTRSSLNHLFTGKRGSSSSGWEIVATQLRCGASALQCKKKWENLQIKYKKIMVPPTGSGLEERSHGAHNWPYFALMNKFMSSRHTMNPLLLIQSFTPTQTAASPNQTRLTSVSDRSMCDRTLPEDLLSSEGAMLSGPSSSSAPSPSSFPFPYSPQPSTSYSPRPSPSYSPQPSPSYSPQPSTSYSPQPSPSCSSLPSPSYSPRPSPSYSPQQSSSYSPQPTSSSVPYLSCVDHPESSKKRRRPASKNTDAITDLMKIVTEDLGKQDRDRKQARKIEEDLLEVLREFLSKK